MGDVSILEFLVYGLICYSGILLVIASAFKDEKLGKSQSAVRVIWLIPSIFAAFMLASIGGFDIYLDYGTTTNTIKNLNTTEVFTEIITSDKKFTLLNPVWIPLHILFFVILMIYVIWNIVMMFGKKT
mgnify:CR=1 FL=1